MPDDSSFIDKLRMNNIFTPGNMNPVSGPDLSAGQLNLNTVTQGINAIQPFIQQAQDKRMRDQQNMMIFQKNLNSPNNPINQPGGRISQIGNNMNDPTQQQGVANLMGATTIGSPNNSNVNPITGMTNAQEAALASQKEQNDSRNKLAQATLAEKTKNDAAKIDLSWDKNSQGWDKNSISRASEQLREWKAQHPNHVFKSIAGGNIVAFDPQHPEQVYDTKVSSGLATSLQQIDERARQNSLLETQRQSGRVDLQNTRGTQQLNQIGARVAGQQQLQDDRQNTPLPGNQSKVDIANKATQLRNQRPDLAPYIEVDQNGRVNISQPSGNGWFDSGPPLGTWNEINSILYGGSGSTNQNSGYTNQSPTTSQGQGINTSPSSSGYKVGIE